MLDPRKIRRPLSRLVAFLLVSVLAGALSVVVLASPVVLATALVKDATTGFGDLPSVLTAPAPFQTSTMLAADGTRIASFYSENRTVVRLSQMSPRVRQAIVAIEDARFYQHGAVDPRGLLRAAVNDVTGGGTQGASTLTQQYVKNLLLQQAQASGDAGAVEAATAPTIARKLREVRLAIGLEQQLTKDEILAGYLNIVYFGEDAYGIEAASERYFGVHASRLTLPQAALLAGIVQEPVADDPLVHPTAAKARRDVVLKAMHDENMITAGEYAAAVRSRVRITGHPLPNGCATAGREGFFCEAVVRSLQTDPEFAALGATPADRLTAISREGLVIRTTLDPGTQAAAEQAVDAKVPQRDRSGLAAAAVTVEPGTGKVVAMAQDRTYSVTPGRGRTSVNYATDAALGGATGFQTGSSFKPFTLATWLDQGHSLDDVVDATPRAHPFSDFTACGTSLRGRSYSPVELRGHRDGPDDGPARDGGLGEHGLRVDGDAARPLRHHRDGGAARRPPRLAAPAVLADGGGLHQAAGLPAVADPRRPPDLPAHHGRGVCGVRVRRHVLLPGDGHVHPGAVLRRLAPNHPRSADRAGMRPGAQL